LSLTVDAFARGPLVILVSRGFLAEAPRYLSFFLNQLMLYWYCYWFDNRPEAINTNFK